MEGNVLLQHPQPLRRHLAGGMEAVLPTKEQGVPVVRFSSLKSVVPVLARSRQPKARKETRLRLQDAIHASLSGAPLLLKVLEQKEIGRAHV